jgi:tRNA 2-selenouridine synthase
MRQSPVYFIDIPFEERLAHIIEEYGALDKEEIRGGIERIRKRLGGLETRNALQFLEDGNIRECFSILLKYYDKHYLKGLHNRQNLSSLLTNISCSSVSIANAHLLNPALA